MAGEYDGVVIVSSNGRHPRTGGARNFAYLLKTGEPPVPAAVPTAPAGGPGS